MEIKTIIISAIITLIISVLTAYVTTKLRIKEEETKWRRDYTITYAEALNISRAKAKIIADQHPFGYLLIQYPDGVRHKNILPTLEKITIGRSNHCPFAENKMTFFNFLPVACKLQQINQATPECAFVKLSVV